MFKYKPEWQGPLSGPSFEKQTEDFLNGIESRVNEIDTRQTPSDATPMAPGVGSAGTSEEYSRGDHSHPLQSSVSGSAGSLETPRTISMSGEGSGSASFDGTSDVAIPLSVSSIATGSTEDRAIADRFADGIVPKDFGAKGDGTTDDGAAFTALEASVSGRMIDLCGLRYGVSSIPCKNYYYNGAFVVSGRDYPAYLSNIFSYYNPDGITGSGVGNGDQNFFICDGWSTPESIQRARSTSVPHLKDVIAIGNLACNGAIKDNIYLADAIALGSGVMSSGPMTSEAQHNIGIGQFALRDITSGDRNIGIGSLAFVASKTIRCSIAIGRDCCQTAVTGHDNVVIGYQAIGGIGATIGVDGKIRSMGDQNLENITAIGALCMRSFGTGANAYNTTAVGSRCAENLKNGAKSVFIGTAACINVEKNVSYNGKMLVDANDSATYVSSGDSVVVTCAGNSAAVGCYVVINFTNGPCAENTDEDQILYVASLSGDAFVLTLPATIGTGSGDCVVKQYETATASSSSNYASVVVGSDVAKEAKQVYASVVLGSAGLNKANASFEMSVIIGDRINDNISRSLKSVIIGHTAGPADNQTNEDVLVGSEAGHVLQGPASAIKQNTALGSQAMYTMIDGSTSVAALLNSTALGHGASVSGSNQVQLGNSSTTTYAYGSVQNRSDARDKTDIRSTILGLDFIKALRPVDFKWDYRDDYVEIVTNEETEEVAVVRHEKDGSRKRNRYHHGLIAQEVKSVLDEKGIDFGGYQDHSINGGNDILSLGYEEFIAPIIKSIQELDARLEALEGA